VIANKQAPTAKNQHATTEELLEVVFSVVYTAAVAMQRHGKPVNAAMNHSAIGELLEIVFSVQSVPRDYQWDKFRA
jgi:hypothetical protein